MPDGDYKTFGGAWVITDGGYQHVQAFTPPMHDRFTKFEVRVYRTIVFFILHFLSIYLSIYIIIDLSI
jgi:hypothetical protein